jgi:sterol desaturase/sphingolipid hydroxylase (fatty acid hydroxylase superfamily)
MLDTFVALFNGAPKLLILCALGLALEYVRPAERNQPASSSIFNFVWIVNFVVMTNVMLYFLGKYVQVGVALLHGPLVTIPFPDTWYGWAGQLALFMFLHDLGYYTMHRCQHTFAWFWAHHKFHHTDEHMNATTSFRHHWLENVYRIPFIFIPLGMVNLSGTLPVVAFDLMLVWAIFTHMNLRLHLGPLTRVFAGPQVHRIHHSNLPQHQNRNFAAFFPIWDILGGTFHKPAPDEFPPCGTCPRELTTSIWQANTGVFREWYRLAREGVRRRLPAPKPASLPGEPK